MTYTYGICETCGTQTIHDEETGAEVHFDVTYQDCGVEGEVSRLADHLDRILPGVLSQRLGADFTCGYCGTPGFRATEIAAHQREDCPAGQAHRDLIDRLDKAAEEGSR